MYFVKELFEKCHNYNNGINKSRELVVKLEKKNKEVEYKSIEDNFYIIENVIYFNFAKENNNKLTTTGLINMLEQEAENGGWGNLYTAPMEELLDCQLEIVNSLMDLKIEFDIVNILEEDNKIIINIKEV